jgi:hypothetical protein
MTPASAALQRLLRRGERARTRGADECVSLVATVASCPEYAALKSWSEVEAFHAEIAAAERIGAIAVQWRGPVRGEGGLKRLILRDLDRLAAHLGVELLGKRISAAAARLRVSQDAHPVVADVLDAWSKGRGVRGRGPEAAGELADAIEAVEASRRERREERVLRRESVRLYGDSKRLERLTPWLDVLVGGELKPSGLSKHDIWAALGLRREPQPMLLAGSGQAMLREGTVPLVRPYIGLPVEAVESIETCAAYLLTIENLASFHDAARAMPDARGLLIYTAGMPSPAWRQLYVRIVRALPATATVYHWGDIDEGGMRIAALLAEASAEAGRRLRPWRMATDELHPLPRGAKSASAASLKAMTRWAAKAGWDDVAAAFERVPFTVEQESIEPSFPD